MNHTYRIVFNRSAGLWKVVSEHARGQGKGGCRRGRSARGRLPLMAMLLVALGTASGTQAGPLVTITGDTTVGSLSSPRITVLVPLSVGISGVGTVTIADGGELWMSLGDTVSLADSASADGTINIGAAPGAAPVGAGFLLTSLLEFGAGTGTLNFNTNSTHDFGAALVSSAAGTHQLNHYAGETLLRGDSSGFAGAVKVMGGRLAILNKLGASEGRIDAGTAAGARAKVDVGSGGAWNIAGNLFVGENGPGELSIYSGGTVSNQFGTVNAKQGGTAQVKVLNANSRWVNSAALSIGSDGARGALTVEQGGYVSSNDAYVGRMQDGYGTVLVTGSGSAWVNGGKLLVGDMSAQGLLSIERGAVVTTVDSMVGSMGGSGSVVVSGAGASWNNTGALNVGFGQALLFGTGSVTIANAGAVTVGANGTGVVALAKDGLFPGFGTTGTINIGAQANQAAVAAGTLNASAIEFGKGNATLNFNHADTGYRFLVPLKSTGNGMHQLNQIAGSTIMEGDSSGFRGATKVSGGKLIVTGKLGGSAEVTGGVLQYGDGATGAANSLSGNLKVSGAGSMLALRGGATLGVAGDVDLADATVLDIAAGAGSPSLQANKVKLGDGVVFKLSGISDRSQLDKVLIQSTNGIDGDFSGVSVGGFTGAVDYLTVHTRKSADGLQYRATYDLSWTANNNLGHGTFTLANPADRFDVGVVLSDQAANTGTGWNGNTLTKAGAGTLVLSGNNTYSGGTVIAGGTLQVANNANLGSGALTFSGGTLAATHSFDTSRAVALAQHGRFDVADGAVLGLTGSVAGSSDLIKSGAGTLRLDKAGNAYGNTWIQSGTLIGNAASISGDVSNGGRLVFEQSINGNFSGSISGAGTLVKQGAGTLALSGDHAAFTGKTTVSAGTLAVQGVLGGSAEVTGGTLQYGNGVAGAANRLSGDLKVSAAGSRLSVQGAATLSVAGDVGLADGTVLDFDGSANGPVLQAGSVTLGDGVAFRINGITGAGMAEKVLIDTQAGISGDFGSVSVGGYSGGVDYLAVNTRKSADQRQYLASYGLSWMANNDQAGGTFTLTGATDRFEAGAALSDQAPNAAKGWNGRSLTKAGAGTLVLSGNNRYTGGTEILGGTLQVARDENLGAASGGLAFNGGTLAATGSFDTARAVTLANSGTFDVADGARLGVNGPISGGGSLVKTGAGTLDLAGNHASYTGKTTVSQGRLIVQGVLGGSAAVTGGSLQYGNGVAGAANRLSGDLKVAGGTLSVQGPAVLSVAGDTDLADGTALEIAAATGRPALQSDRVLLGDGVTFRLAGISDTSRLDQVLIDTRHGISGDFASVSVGGFTGAVDYMTVNTRKSADNMQYLATYGLSWSAGNNLAHGTFTLTNATDSFQVGAALTDQAGNAASGWDGRTLTKAGAGTLVLSGDNSYGGGTTISGGVLQVGRDANLGAATGGLSFNGGTLATTGTFDTARAITLAQAGGFDVAAGTTLGLAGTVSGGGMLIKAGGGTLVLSGNNTYAGGTRIVGGSVRVAQDASLGAASGALTFDGGALATTASFDTSRAVLLAQSGSFDVAAGTVLGLNGTVSGGGMFAKTGAGTLVLGGSNTHAGGTRVDGGILQVARDANLGAAAGAVTFGDGTLATTASFDTTRAISLMQSGRFDVAAGTALGLSGTVSGAGGFAKLGAGTLILSASNSHAGGTEIAGGVLQVAQDANLGAAAGALTFNGGTLATTGSFDTARTVALAQTGTFDVAANTTLGLTGMVTGSGNLIKTGAGTLRLDNSANAYGNTLIQDGILVGNAASIQGNVDNNGTLVFDQGANASFGGAISGNGSLVKSGAGTLGLTGDSSGFTGSTTVQGGRLALNGKLGGGLNIGAGGVLAGAGTVGSGAGSTVTVAAGATLAPGNSIGTLTVDGDLVIESGARYAVETNPQGAEADLIHVTGNATINGGSVAHIGIDGDYGLRSVYTLLTVDGALSGRFDTVTSDYAFLTPKLGYDYGAGRVSLELARNGTAMASVAASRNQRAAAGAIDSIGMAAGNGLYDAIAVLPDDKGLLRSSFDQLSGEIHASAKTVLFEDSRYVRDAASERLRSAAGAVGASAAPVLASSGGGARLAPATAMGPASWIQGLGSWRQTDGDGNAAQVKSSTGGFLLGADATVSDAWRLGLMAGYTRSDFDVRDRASSGDSDNYHLGAYGGGQWGALGLRGGLAYSWHDIATRRSVSMPGYSDRLKANYDGRTVQAFADLSYRIDTRIAALEPFANLAYVNLKTDGYSESGGAAALRANSQTTETTYTTLGSRVMSSFELGSAQATARGSLGWRYAFGDLKPTATQAFSAGDAFTVAGVPIAKNSAVLEAGLDVQVSRKVSFDLSYQGQLASGAQDHGVRAGVSMRF